MTYAYTASRQYPAAFSNFLLACPMAGVLLFAVLLPLVARTQTITYTYNSSTSITVPAGVTSLEVECWGGGGKGGSRSSTGNSGGAGGGAYVRSTLSVTPGTTHTITVGSGSATNGVAGGDSWFSTTGTILSKGGSSVAVNGGTGATGGTAGASIGTLKYAGGNGANGSGSGSGSLGGGGGSSAGTGAAGNNGSGTTGATAPTGGGNGGNGGTNPPDEGSNGVAPGGGGGGARQNGTGNTAGGNGANGRVRVTFTVPTVLYSRASGNVTDAIWSDTPGGTALSAIWTAATSMVVQNGHVVTNTADVSIRSLTVDAGGTLVLNGGTNLQVNGPTVAFNGAVVANTNSTLSLLGTSATALSTAAALNLWDLTVNTTAGTTATGTIQLLGSLRLNGGNFNASGATVVLASNSSYTGRLGQVAGGASYSGNLTVERYIPGGATNWRLLGSPVGSNTIANWNDDIFTAGFPGSNYPNFYDPPSSGIFWPSIRWYNETNTGANVNDGLVGVSGTGQSLSTGQGFAVWSGDALGGTSAFVMDVTGPPHIAASPIGLPITWTNTGSSSVDGWNLVSNPLPSAIQFTAISRGANVANQYHVYNPANGNNAVWSAGVGTNGANGVIQSSQGFWLKANGSSVTTTVAETAKVNDNTGGIFGGQSEPLPMVRLRVGSTLNSFSDEVVMVFEDGLPGLDENDGLKFIFGHAQAPQIFTRSTDAVDLAINRYGTYAGTIAIPVHVDVPVTGTYSVTASDMGGLDELSCLVLEDLLTGSMTPLQNDAAYGFIVNASDDASQPRFMLHASAAPAFVPTGVTCFGDQDGQAVIVLEAPGDLQWFDTDGVLLAEEIDALGEVVLGGLAAGNYEVRMGSDAGCGTLVRPFAILTPMPLDAQLDLVNASCPGTVDGSIGSTVTGGTAPYEYLWSTGASESSITAPAGTYSVTVTDSRGCERTWDELLVTEGMGPEALFSLVAGEVLVNEPVSFVNLSTMADASYWDFGDGTFSEDMEPVHAYALPGTYVITLSVDGAGCSDVYQAELVVQLGTSVGTPQRATELAAWSNGHQILVDLPYAHGRVVHIEVLDATGRLYMQRQVPGSPGRVLLPADQLGTGIWFVRVTSDDVQRTIRVPLIR